MTTFGDIARREGNYLEAEAKYEESLGLFREFANKNGMASGYHNLGYTRLRWQAPRSGPFLRLNPKPRLTSNGLRAPRT